MTQRKMKDSGVVWIGQVPEGWNSSRIKYVIKERVGGAWGNDPSEETGENVICLRIADFDFERGVFKNTDEGSLTVRNYTKRQASLLGLKLGDILVEKSGGGDTCPVGRCVLFDKSYKALFANFMDRLRADDALCVARFLQYWWKMMYLQKVTWLYVKQTIGIQNLSLTNLLNTELVALPSLPEQRKIAAFLDGECGKIDRLRGKVEKQIAALEEYRKSVITEAVTKGIRRGRKMKPSGVEWMSEVPSEWEMIRIGYLYDAVNERGNDQLPILSVSISSGVSDKQLDDEELDRKVNRSEDKSTYKHVAVGDLTYNQMRAWQGAFGTVTVEGMVSPAYVVCRPKSELNTRFIEYVLRTDAAMREIKRRSTGIVDFRLRLYWPEFKTLKIPYPSADEQHEIAAYLDKKCAAIDSMVAKCREELERLAEYKKSLIYEYVTGKKEVA